jgi:hypothetical protein
MLSPYLGRSYGRRRPHDYEDPYARSYGDLIRRVEDLDIRNGTMSGAYNLRDRHRPPKNNLNWNLDYATAVIVEFLTKSAKEGGVKIARAIDRVRHHTYGANDAETILCEVFDSIDEALFDTKLRDGVYLDWAPLERKVTGATVLPGKASGRVAIILNSGYLRSRETDASRLLSILAHQMIHAYFLIACPEPPQGHQADERLSHGKHFCKIMQTIQSLFALHGRGLSMMGSPEMGLDLSHGSNRISEHSAVATFGYATSVDASPSRSICPLHAACNNGDLDEWYSLACAPLLKAPKCTHLPVINTVTDGGKVVEISRSSAGPSETYMEFVFNNKSYQCFLNKINVHAGFKKKYKQVMEIPKPVPEFAFKSLMSFLNTGTYDPDISKVQLPGGTGPPLIIDPKPNEPAYLLTAITVLKLADALSFPELATNAHHRLTTQHLTAEDPISILSEIYDPSKSYLPSISSPSSDPRHPTIPHSLRTWSREWLHKHDPAPPPLHSIPTTASPLAGSNLARLALDPRFGPLMARSPPLADDVRAAKEHLVLLAQMAAVAGGVGGGGDQLLLQHQYLLMQQQQQQQQQQRRMIGGVGGGVGVGAGAPAMGAFAPFGGTVGNPAVNAATRRAYAAGAAAEAARRDREREREQELEACLQRLEEARYAETEQPWYEMDWAGLPEQHMYPDMRQRYL